MNKLLAPSQDELDFILEHSPQSPLVTMLGNVIYLARMEIKRINAENLLEEVIETGDTERAKEWRKQ